MAIEASRFYRVWLVGGAVVAALGVAMAVLVAFSSSEGGSVAGMLACAGLFVGGAFVSAVGYIGLRRRRGTEREPRPR